MEAYGKVALVPGVEWVPGGQMGRGPGVQPMNAPGRAGPLICIESAWSSLARRQAREGAGWLVNVTNDAWLGESATWTRTPAFRQHPRHLAFRSVETGLGALRAANNGLTGVVHPSGRWELLLPPHRAGVAVTTVESLPSATPFAMTGDLAGPLSLLALLAALSLVAVGRRSPVDHDDPGL